MPALSERSYWTDIFEASDEGKAKKDLEARIQQQERVVAMANQLLSMEGLPGYAEFRKSLQDLHDHAVKQLVRSTSSDSWLRVLQGQSQAYESILSIMEKGQARVDALAVGLKDLQNQRAMFDRPKTKKAER